MSLSNPKYPGIVPMSVLFACLALTGAALLSYIIETLDAEEWDPALADAGNTTGEWLAFWVVAVLALLVLLRIIYIFRNPRR